MFRATVWVTPVDKLRQLIGQRRANPFIFTVDPAALSPVHSTLYGMGLQETVAGEGASYIVELRDEYGNLLTRTPEGDDEYTVAHL
eukprot:COSAG05_NODE_23690_length_256_cov_0.656051_1_plen_85_part_11